MRLYKRSVIIGHLRKPGGQTVLAQIITQVGKQNAAVSMITIQELYQGNSTRDAKVERSLLEVIAPLHILPYTYEIAELAGKLVRDREREILQFQDSAIAATSIIHAAELATLNTKDFKNIRGLELYKLPK